MFTTWRAVEASVSELKPTKPAGPYVGLIFAWGRGVESGMSPPQHTRMGPFVALMGHTWEGGPFFTNPARPVVGRLQQSPRLVGPRQRSFVTREPNTIAT